MFVVSIERTLPFLKIIIFYIQNITRPNLEKKQVLVGVFEQLFYVFNKICFMVYMD